MKYLLLLFFACSEIPIEDASLGVEVLDWGAANNAERADLSEEVAACAHKLDAVTRHGEGGRLIHGAKIEIGDCGDGLAGCWWPDSDLIVLAPGGGALCHELFHRARYIWRGDADYVHGDLLWWDGLLL